VELAAVVDAGSEAEGSVELALDCGGGDEQATIIMSDVDANL
jgi:hypothetical protein